VEELLQLLNEMSFRAYSDSENAKLAAYLLGEHDFSQIEPIIANKSCYSIDLNKIRNLASLAASDEQLLQALGRFLKIARIQFYNPHIFSACIGKILNAGFSWHDFYSRSGLGAGAFAIDLLDYCQNCNNYYFHEYDALFAESGCAALCEDICRTHPEILEKLAENEKFGLFGMAFLHANGWNYSKQIISQIVRLIDLSEKDLKELAERFASNPHFDELAKAWGNGVVSGETQKSKIFAFTLAFQMNAGKDELLDLLYYSLMKEPLNLEIMEDAAAALGYENAFDFFQYSTALSNSGFVPKDSLICHWAGKLSYNDRWDNEIKEKFSSFVFANETASLSTIYMAFDHAAAYVADIFWTSGKHLNLTGEFEKRIIGDIAPDSIAMDKVKEWLENPKCQAFPFALEIGRDIVIVLAYMTNASALPGKLLSSSAQPGGIRFADDFFNAFAAIRGVDALPGFIKTLNIEKPKLIFLLLEARITLYNDELKKKLKEIEQAISEDNAALYEEAYKFSSAKGRLDILETVFEKDPLVNDRWLISVLEDSSKTVRNFALAALEGRSDLAESIAPLAKSGKKVLRESADKLLASYGLKNPEESSDALSYCRKHCSNAPKAIGKWVDFSSLPKVRIESSEEYADDLILQSYIYAFSSRTEMTVPAEAKMLGAGLDKDDLRAFSKALYSIWKAGGAQAKLRGVILLAAINGDDAFVNTLKADITQWADNSRGQIASEAVKAMALQGGNYALMTVDAISSKFPNKQVKRAAEEAFGYAAKELGVDPEALADRIIPNLGFDSRGKQVIDYGSRQFTVSLTQDLQLELRNPDGKSIKSLPSPGAKDDKIKAQAAKEQFSALKKSLKSVASMQRARLEQALSQNRTWRKNEWIAIFVENPLMNMFATGLVWGLYDEGGNLTESFRYMEDGTFTNQDEEEVELSSDFSLGLCHPLDLGKELNEKWKAQLEDYEIAQPFEQLGRTAFTLSHEEGGEQSLKAFGGAVLPIAALAGKLQGFGWRRGSVLDAGGYSSFYKEIAKQNVGVQLNFSGTYIGADPSEEVTVYDAAFYKAGTVERGSYVYDDIKKENLLKFSDVPPRLYSEICYDLERALANRARTDPDWENNEQQGY
jgi:hypothetical protein